MTLSTNNTKCNLKSLQILRAIAATSVVYFHIGATSVAYFQIRAIPLFGSFGIDIFFVISGFVMAMVIANGQSLRIFAVSRLTRIVPLYWIFTTCFLILAAIKPELLNSTTANITNYLKSIFFIPYLKEDGAQIPMIAVGWTLNYEMYFYVCIWLSIVVIRKLYILLTIFFLLAAPVLFGKYSDSAVLQNFFGSSMVFEFVFGILAFYVYKTHVFTKFASTILFLIALLSYVFMVYVETLALDVSRVYVYGIPSIALVLSITALEDANFVKGSSIANILAIIGDASYATYLSHVYVIEAIRRIAFQKLNLINPYTPFGVLIIVSFSLAVGHVIYILCDKPLNKYFKKKLL